jgi:hypothetical protein
MATPHLFERPWRRLERAKAHRKRFADIWNEFLDSEPYETVCHIDADGEGVISVDAKPIPEELSVVLGELLYQLRAALDSCIYELAIIDSGQDPPTDAEKLEFPIRNDSRTGFDSVAWKLGPLTDEHRGWIETIQPYRMQAQFHWKLSYMFWSLDFINDWARKDRHRGLHVVASWAANKSPLLNLPSGVYLRAMLPTPDGLLEEESEVARFFLDGWKPGMDCQANPNLTIDVALQEAPPPRSDDDTLNERVRLMISTVSVIIESLEQQLA